jgi:hypothetical protein
MLSKRSAIHIIKKSDSPEIDIDPSIKSNILEAVEKLRAIDNNYFKLVERIVGMPDGPFGKTDGKTIFINYPRVVQDVKSRLGDLSDPKEQSNYKDLLLKSLMSLLAHEIGHINNYKDDSGFSGGEGPAKAEEDRIKHLISSCSLLISKRARKY